MIGQKFLLLKNCDHQYLKRSNIFYLAKIIPKNRLYENDFFFSYFLHPFYGM